MKSPILIAIMAILCLSVKAQKLEKPKIDPISGDTSVYSKRELIYNKFSLVPDILSFQANRISLPGSKPSYSMVFSIVKGYGSNFTIAKGSSLSIKFKDGKIIQIPATLDASSNYFHSSGTQIGSSYVEGSSGYQATGWYTLSSDDLNILCSDDPIVFIRIETSEAPFDYEIKSRNSNVIQKHLKLITSSK